jgi:RNA polymerase sigma factor (sigma-70 family)
MLSPNELTNLLAKLPGGDQLAWKLFINNFHPLIQGTIVKYVSPQDAEDITQQVYLALMEKDFHLIRKFESDSYPAFLIYIQRIAQNVGMRWREKHAKDSEGKTHFENGHSEIKDPRFDIEFAFINQESSEEFQLKLNKLSIKYREVIALNMEGYKAREIAEILKINTNTALTRIRRGKEKLKNFGSVK